MQANIQSRERQLDPRTKLLILVIALFLTAYPLHLWQESLVIIILLLPYFWSRKYRSFFLFLSIYLSQLMIAYWLLPQIKQTFILYILSFYANGFRGLLPALIAGSYVVRSTPLSYWLALFKHWRLPRYISVPIAVMFRFFPTIKSDYQHIRKAMAFRGINLGAIGLLKNPLRSLEYIIVPLLMNASIVAEDLTISALTKGLDLPGPHSSRIQLEFSRTDYCVMLLYLCLLAFIILGRFQ